MWGQERGRGKKHTDRPLGENRAWARGAGEVGEDLPGEPVIVLGFPNGSALTRRMQNEKHSGQRGSLENWVLGAYPPSITTEPQSHCVPQFLQM